MCVHCLIQLLGQVLGYFRLALCMMFPIFASSDISEGGSYSNGDSASTSSESAEDMELNMEEDISGVIAKIDGGFPIQCQEDILYQLQILEESLVNPEIRGHVSLNLIASGGLIQCNGSRRFIDSHLRDEYIDMHPEISISGIQAEQDQQNAEFHLQATRAFQALLECEEGWNSIRFSQVIHHDSIYQDFLIDPDRNMVRNPVQVTDDKSTSGSGFAEVTGLNVPGTESGHTPMRSNSPFDGGTELSEPVQNEDLGATGGAPITDELVRSIRRGTLCIVCKKRTVQVKFKACGHAVCCFKCASGVKQCNICTKKN